MKQGSSRVTRKERASALAEEAELELDLEALGRDDAAFVVMAEEVKRGVVLASDEGLDAEALRVRLDGSLGSGKALLATALAGGSELTSVV